ncbi:LacI family DNA-binding transcriptional regulator [Lactococcus muris]|uniref:LacI family DNA-binding transcriptional regulator n=1 Tax=Lactococcus muris TaxID=2941330 RepID=UPI002301DD4B
MVTIKQVAEEAGVSKSTVSRYISQNGYVSQEAQEKIEAAITKLNFVPNLSARSLKTKHSQIVGLLLPDISNPFFPMLAKGVEKFLKEHGYRVLLGNIGEDNQFEEDYLKVLMQTNAAGVITTNDFREAFPEIKLPTVIVDRVGQKSDFGVFSDNLSGGKIAAYVIVEAGAKKVAVISGPVTAESINNRFKASIAYLKKTKTHYETFYSQSYDFDEILKEAKQVLKHNDFDSIIAPSDIHAMAYIRELHHLGKRIPEDVQIIGYDDILMSQYMYPALSTIHQDAYEMGYEAAKLIYKLSLGQEIKSRQLQLPVRYVERETIRKRESNE